MERFGIQADEVLAACGANKTAAFRGCLARSDLNEDETFVFGDDASDFQAADQLDIWHLGNPWVCGHASYNVASDIAWFDAERLIGEPVWTDLRYVGEHDDPRQAVWHRGSLLACGPDTLAMGRYFKAGRRRHKEPLSQAVIEAKQATETLPLLREASEVVFQRLADTHDIDHVVSVPPHAGKVDRFRAYRALACDTLAATDEVDLQIANDVPAGYRLMARERKRALRAGRYRCDADIGGRTVLAIDDVLTTGSSLGAVRDALVEAGAERVIQLAWAATQD